MTGINCVEAAKHWKDECTYLDAIGFVRVIDVNGPDAHIGIPIDEECNGYNILTPKAARHIAKKLIHLANILDKRKGVK